MSIDLENRTHTLVTETLDTAIKRLVEAHTALSLQHSDETQVVAVALGELRTVRAFWCGDSSLPNMDVAHSLRVIAKDIQGLNHDKVRSAYQDIREAEGIVQDNTIEGVPVSR